MSDHYVALTGTEGNGRRIKLTVEAERPSPHQAREDFERSLACQVAAGFAGQQGATARWVIEETLCVVREVSEALHDRNATPSGGPYR
jgi:hypothetical protein